MARAVSRAPGVQARSTDGAFGTGTAGGVGGAVVGGRRPRLGPGVLGTRHRQGPDDEAENGGAGDRGGGSDPAHRWGATAHVGSRRAATVASSPRVNDGLRRVHTTPCSTHARSPSDGL